jgi:hypothetical protein
MKIDGGCYCGAVRYSAEGDPLFRAQCHCRECQYIAGGSPNVFVVMPEAGFKYTKSQPKQFARKDIPAPVTRDFCAECGTHILTRTPRVPGGLVLKVGTFDDPSQFAGPQAAIWLCDKQSFHQVPNGVAGFERLPNA